MKQNHISENQNQQQNYYSEAKENYLNLNTKPWFCVPDDSWFLNKDDTRQIQGIESWFDSPAEVYRMINKPKKRKRADLSLVDVQISKDPALLQQYYDLREASYRAEWNFANYNGQENEFDKNGKIFLAIFDGKVVAGARLVVSSDVPYLTHEDPTLHFTYSEICKNIDIDLSEVLYGEISAIASDRNFRGQIIDNIFSSIGNYCRANNIKYILGIATLNTNRNSHLSLNRIGVKSFILDKIAAPKKPQFNNIDCCPIVVVV